MEDACWRVEFTNDREMVQMEGREEKASGAWICLYVRVVPLCSWNGRESRQEYTFIHKTDFPMPKKMKVPLYR